jgi:diacylglycerol kinase family enzyme
LFDVVVIKDFKLWQVPKIAYKLFNGDVCDLPFVQTFKTDQISITRDEREVANIDGEAMVLESNINFKMFKQSLKIIVG